MNIIYQSDNITIVDDRESITLEQAFQILWDGGTIEICYPPDYGAENENEIYDSGIRIDITDIYQAGEWEKISFDNAKQVVFNYLLNYEIYK